MTRASASAFSLSFATSALRSAVSVAFRLAAMRCTTRIVSEDTAALASLESSTPLDGAAAGISFFTGLRRVMVLLVLFVLAAFDGVSLSVERIGAELPLLVVGPP